MSHVVIALDIAGLVAALAIVVGFGFVYSVVFHRRRVLGVLASLVTAALVFALPVTSTIAAWHWAPGAGYAVWIVPIAYLVLVVPLVAALLVAASAAAQP